MKYGVLFFATLFCSITYSAEMDCAPCPSRQPEWVGVFGPIDGDGVVFDRDAYFDSRGNVFLAGKFRGFVDFDPSEGVEQFKALDQIFDAFLLKINADGSYAWTFVQQAPADGAGSVGISENPHGNLVLATGRAANPGVPRIHVTWLTQNGSPLKTVDFLFGAALGGAGNLAVAPNGDVYLSGEFLGTVDFDPSAEVDWHTSSGWDPFVTKLGADGSYAWTRTFGGGGADGNAGVASDPEGNVIITGTFRGSVDFDPGPGVDIHVQSPGTIEDSFVTKFLADGSYGWTRTYPLRWINGKGKPAVDRQGNIFFTDNFGGTIDFDPDGPGGEHSATNGDVIVVKLSPDGNYVWSFSTSDGTGGENGEAVAIGANDDVYVTGTFQGVSDFDPGPDQDVHISLSGGGFNAFVMKLTSEGQYVSTMTMTHANAAILPKYIGTTRDNVLLIGEYQTFPGPMDFDPTCEVQQRETGPNSNGDFFVARYACIEPTADFSGDGFIELKEFARMAWCLTGPGFVPVAQPLSAEALGDSGDDPPEPIICHPGCAIQDLDADGDIDLADLARFANAFTGAP